MTRAELIDELWDAMMDRHDVHTDLLDLAEACVERLESLNALAAQPQPSSEERSNPR